MTKVHDASTVKRRRDSTFRRKSIESGMNIPILSLEAVPKAANLQEEAEAGIFAAELAKDLISTIKGCESVVPAIKQWAIVNQLEKMDGSFFVLFLTELGNGLYRILKMARKGFKINVLLMLGAAYGDFFGDCSMLYYYRNKGDTGRFQASVGIMSLAMSVHIWDSWTNNTHCTLKRKLIRVLQTIFFMNPIIYTWKKWSGDDAEEGSTKKPGVMLSISILIELIFESIPCMIIQLTGMIASESVDLIPALSICFSIFATGFTIADLSIENERRQMTENLRGPYCERAKRAASLVDDETNPLNSYSHSFGSLGAATYWCGCLPEKFGLVFQLGHIMVNSGYFATTVLAMTLSSLVLEGWVLPVYLLTELILFDVMLILSGRARQMNSNNNIGITDFIRPDWQILAFFPMLSTRQEFGAGGAICSRFVCFRLVLGTLVSFYCASAGTGVINLESDTVLVLATVAAAMTVLGLTLVVVFSSDHSRWTFYKTKYNPVQFFDHYILDNPPLDYCFSSRDEFIAHIIVCYNPYYWKGHYEEFQKWCLSLKIEDALFLNGNKVPDGVIAMKGQNWESAFARIRYRFEYFQNEELGRKLKIHFDQILGDLAIRGADDEERKTRVTKVLSGLKQKNQREDDVIATLLEEIERLKEENEMLRGDANLVK